jgi:flagellar export protein FliJ
VEVSPRDRGRVERVRRVREIQAELALGELRHSHAERVRADQRLAAASSDLGAWERAHSGAASAALFGLRRSGLGSQAQLVARVGLDVRDAVEREEVDRHEWVVRARKVEGLDRLIDRIIVDERDLQLREERAVLDEFVAGRVQREYLTNREESR